MSDHEHQPYISADTAPPVIYCKCGAILNEETGDWHEPTRKREERS